MAHQHHERRRHFRGKPRRGRVLPVKYRVAGGEWRSGETRNIGVGGAFIEGGDGIAVGDEVEIELTLPELDRSLPLRGVVRRAGAVGDDDGAGLGIEFVGVDVDVLLDLNDYFASLTGVDE